MSNPLWQRIAADAGVELTEAQLAQLAQYLDSLIEWNQRMNLTRIVDRANAEVRHIADALTVLRFLPPHRPAEAGLPGRVRKSVVDVGTGGGVPGLPLAIARPDLDVTLVDATKKKVDAIDAMIAAVGVRNATTLHARAESIARTFDVVVVRAVAELDQLLEWCNRLMHRHSVMLAMKGPRAVQEMEAIPMKVRKHFHLHSVPVEIAELPGHVIVRITRA